MRVYDENTQVIEPYIKVLTDSVEHHVLLVSRIIRVRLKYEIDLDVLKDNTDFIKVAKAYNVLGIGIVPYKYRYNSKDYIIDKYDGFTDIATKNILYININIPEKSIKRTALNLFILAIKNIDSDLFDTFLETLKQDKAFNDFCNSPFNIKLLKAKKRYEDTFLEDSLANFYSQFPDNDKIATAFLNRIIYKDDKSIMQKLTQPQQKYLNILMEVAEGIRN